MSYDRIVIIGKPGAGKTTLARQLVTSFQLKHVELDAIHWQPNWGIPDKADFRRWVSDALPANERWVTDGNYSVTRDIVWGRADLAIWLDFPLWLTLWRLFWRTLARWFWQKELWNGNRENLTDHLSFDKDKNLFLFAIGVHSRHREEYPAALKKYSSLKVLRFRHPKELDQWLATFTKT